MIDRYCRLINTVTDICCKSAICMIGQLELELMRVTVISIIVKEK